MTTPGLWVPGADRTGDGPSVAAGTDSPSGARRVGKWEWERALRESDVKQSVKGLLFLMSSLMAPDGSRCYPSVATLARYMSVARSTAVGLIAEATAAGWLEVVSKGGTAPGQGGSGKTSLYLPTVLATVPHGGTVAPEQPAATGRESRSVAPADEPSNWSDSPEATGQKSRPVAPAEQESNWSDSQGATGRNSRPQPDHDQTKKSPRSPQRGRPPPTSKRRDDTVAVVRAGFAALGVDRDPTAAELGDLRLKVTSAARSRGGIDWLIATLTERLTARLKEPVDSWRRPPGHDPAGAISNVLDQVTSTARAGRGSRVVTGAHRIIQPGDYETGVIKWG